MKKHICSLEYFEQCRYYNPCFNVLNKFVRLYFYYVLVCLPALYLGGMGDYGCQENAVYRMQLKVATSFLCNPFKHPFEPFKRVSF